MQLARIIDGRVAEILAVPAGFAAADCYHPDILTASVEAPDDVAEGWLYRGETFTPPEPIEPVPAVTPDIISDRQFAEQCAVQGLITEAEALAWVGPGTIPATLIDLIDQLPEPMHFPARMMLTGATTFDRRHDLTVYLTDLFGWTASDRDAFWTAAAAL